MATKKRILILGSTGNLGKQALSVIRRLKEYKVAGLSTNNNAQELLRQIKAFKPYFAVIANKEEASQFKTKNCKIYTGEEGLSEAIRKEKIDCVFNALQSTVGILPTIAAIRKGRKIFMANKESLVAAGTVIMKEAAKFGAEIIPVDSEHSAIFQCLKGEKLIEVDKVILTCSGGYRGRKYNPTINDLIKKSAWDMGKKITVDSATLMNKGFEILEAQALFNFPPDKIEVVIHPEAIVHSMVKFYDGQIKALIGPKDMRFPVLYALTHPKRKNVLKNQLSLSDLKLNFKQPDIKKFPCLKYAYDAAKIGGVMPAVLVSVNEVAVEYYLRKMIGLKDIPRIIKEIVFRYKAMFKAKKRLTLSNIFAAIETAKQMTGKWVKENYVKCSIKNVLK